MDDNRIIKPRIGSTIILATLAINIFALALPLSILQIFDRVVPNNTLETLAYLCVGLVVVAVLELALRIARNTLLGQIANEFDISTSRSFLSATMETSPDDFSKVPAAVHLERFAAISHLRDLHAGQGRLAKIELPFAGIFICFIGFIGGWLILVPVVGIALLCLFTMGLIRMQEPIFEARKDLDARRYSFLLEILSKFKTVKLNTMENQLLRRYEMLQGSVAKNSRKAIAISGLSQSFGALYAQSALLTMGILGGFLVIQGNIGIAELAACMLLNGRTVQPFVRILGVWAQNESGAASEQKVQSALMMRSATGSKRRYPEHVSGRIYIRDLVCEDQTKDQPQPEPATALIHEGDIVAITGSSPDAHINLFKILVGEARPHSGLLNIGGYLPCEAWPRLGTNGVVYAGRTPFLFKGSLLQNISNFGDGEQVKHALNVAQAMGLNDIVHSLPMGYNTMVENGFAFDQSTLKTITIVRALAQNPNILLLDDPTYGLDWRAVQKIGSVLRQASKTMIVVFGTNDPAMLDHATNIIDLTPKDTWCGHEEDPRNPSQSQRVTAA